MKISFSAQEKILNNKTKSSRIESQFFKNWKRDYKSFSFQVKTPRLIKLVVEKIFQRQVNNYSTMHSALTRSQRYINVRR